MDMSPERQKKMTLEIVENLKNNGISPNLFSENFIFKVKNIEPKAIPKIYKTNELKDNTNFIYEIIGSVNDDLMEKVNNLYNIQKKINPETGEQKKTVAIGDRIRMIKNAGCDIKFVSPVKDVTARNLVLSGGRDMLPIIGESLKYYYWHGEGKKEFAPFKKTMEYIAENNPAGYEFSDTKSIYEHKFSDLLYNMFTGMKLGTSWDGRSSVNGGYIIMKSDGDVLAYHSCIADEFKDFLLASLGFETPSSSRHDFMKVYKENGKYFIKFNLQIRFI
jgi:hypothetical protein